MRRIEVLVQYKYKYISLILDLSSRTCCALGVSRRECFKYATGGLRVSRTQPRGLSPLVIIHVLFSRLSEAKEATA
jgi:hypothetical protein